MPSPRHNDLPEVHPVTGEPLSKSPAVVKRDPRGVYVTRDTEIGEPDTGANVVAKTPREPMSAAQIKQMRQDEKPVPIELTYKFEGTCPKCNTFVDTLHMDVARKFVVVAYCSKCRTNIVERVVRRLNAKAKK